MRPRLKRLITYEWAVLSSHPFLCITLACFIPLACFMFTFTQHLLKRALELFAGGLSSPCLFRLSAPANATFWHTVTSVLRLLRPSQLKAKMNSDPHDKYCCQIILSRLTFVVRSRAPSEIALEVWVLVMQLAWSVICQFVGLHWVEAIAVGMSLSQAACSALVPKGTVCIKTLVGAKLT